MRLKIINVLAFNMFYTHVLQMNDILIKQITTRKNDSAHVLFKVHVLKYTVIVLKNRTQLKLVS